MSADRLRCVLLPVEGGLTLVPASVVAEVVNYGPPEPMSGLPEWVLGRSSWRDRVLPVVSLDAVLSSRPPVPVPTHARLAVLYGLVADDRVPYYGVQTHGTPRVVQVGRDGLSDAGGRREPYVLSRVSLAGQGQVLVVPDLRRLHEDLRAALATAEAGGAGAYGAG